MSQLSITLMIFFPILGALLQMASFEAKAVGKWTAFATSFASAVLGVLLVSGLDRSLSDIQFVEQMDWVGAYSIRYVMGLDGLNALLVLLISIVFPLLLASEWDQKSGAPGMRALFLILQAALLGTVCAQDLFLVFFFWALSSVPFYFLVGIWGGKNRESAAFRMAVAQSLSLALFFAALILVYYAVEPRTFSIAELSGGKLAGKTVEVFGRTLGVSTLAFVLFSLGLMLRAPVWPFHGWFTETAEEAPSSVFVALTSGVVPVSAYLFLRLSYTLFPESISQAAPFVVSVGVVNLLMGSLSASAQKTLPLLLAFLGLSEVGLIMIGIGSLSSSGLMGAVFHVFVMGLSLAGFGLGSGVLINRFGSPDFTGDRFGGTAIQQPAIAVVVGLVMASVLGLPGLSGFVGHALIVLGGYGSHPAAVLIVGGCFVLLVSTLFGMYRSIFFGKARSDRSDRENSDLSIREKAYLLPIIGGLLSFGVYPKPLLDLIRPTVLTLLSLLK